MIILWTNVNGAANMNYLEKEVASYVLKESPEVYVCFRNFNLSLASVCKIPVIISILGIHKTAIISCNTSPKR